MSKDSTDQNNIEIHPDPHLAAFARYLQDERNASDHTKSSYRMDIEQFVRLVLEKDPAQEHINWLDVDVP